MHSVDTKQDHKPRVLVAMSGGVDSSVAAALLQDAGYGVAGVTMKLWGGPSDTGCCSVSDVDDARWVADGLGIEHHVFNFGDDFEKSVVDPYLQDHIAGRTPNPCVECNRHIKFDRLFHRATALGFDYIATGHHARIVPTPDGKRIARGVDGRKDQSYVLHMLGPTILDRLLLPIGDITKEVVRAEATKRNIRTATKPDSQDVCFITASAGRREFLASRIPLRSGRVVTTSGQTVGSVAAVELLTIGQRRGLGDIGQTRQYVLDVRPDEGIVVVGDCSDLDTSTTKLESWEWAIDTVFSNLYIQTSAHGNPATGVVDTDTLEIRWDMPHRTVAPGQSVVAYDDELVVGGGIAALMLPHSNMLVD